MSSIDLHDQSARTNFYITFTSSEPFPDSFGTALAKWHARKCDSCLLVTEGGPGTDKHLHFHSVGSWKTSNTSNVTAACKTLYKKHKIEWSKNAVRVKSVPELYGLFHYLMKDVSEGEPLMILGWKLSWIKEKILANLKKMPHSMLLKSQYTLSPKTQCAIVCKYAECQGLQITCKDSFKSVCIRMVKDKYDFTNVRWKALYAHVLVHFGNDHAFDDMMESELFGLR